jgi:hypothetical protein
MAMAMGRFQKTGFIAFSADEAVVVSHGEEDLVISSVSSYG